MGLLTKLKSLLGFEDDRSQVRRGESGVTIERDPDESARPDAETESAVKGVDAGGEESTREPATGREETATGREETATSREETATESEGTTTAEPEETAADATTTPEGIEEAESDRGDEAAAADATTDATGADPTGETEAEPSPEAADDSAAESDEVGIGTDEAGTATDEAETGDADVESEFEEAVAEAAGAGEPLEDVKGIGPAYAERLRDAGVADVADLAGADADRLAEETDLSAKRISRWIERAGAR